MVQSGAYICIQYAFGIQAVFSCISPAPAAAAPAPLGQGSSSAGFRSIERHRQQLQHHTGQRHLLNVNDNICQCTQLRHEHTTYVHKQHIYFSNKKSLDFTYRTMRFHKIIHEVLNDKRKVIPRDRGAAQTS